MNCAWNELLVILPPGIREEVAKKSGEFPQEIRLRIGASVELVTAKGNCFLSQTVSSDHLSFVINTASRYSPWTAASMAKGYLTSQGGHRIGICGDTVMENGAMKGFQTIQYLCIRVARDFPGICNCLGPVSESVLILGAPGWGKTTLLRDLIRSVSEFYHISVVDERGELFPKGFSTGIHTDILYGCPKSIGIELVLKNMGPDYIAVDEITSQADCEALLNAAHCGVKLLATVHASSIQDLSRRPLYQKLQDANIFGTYVVMSPDKHWKAERKML